MMSQDTTSEREKVMTTAEKLVEVWRGPILECVHRGHAVICDSRGQQLASWGNPEQVILPRSSCKMIQALPLVESGAADAFGLKSEHLALACASHQGAAIHTSRVEKWLAALDLGEADLRCGPQVPSDAAARQSMYKTGNQPCQIHNNCSGKHSGFLTVAKHLNAGPEYVDVNHPVQLAVKEAFEDVTDQTSPGFGIDGCSAPNFSCTLIGLARAMSQLAVAREDMGSARERSEARLRQAILAHPELVAGEQRACTELMRAMEHRVAVKTGAEGVFVAILPERGLGVAVKVEDGATRASECAIASLLVRLGAANANDPLIANRLMPALTNRAGLSVGQIRPSDALFQGGNRL